MMEYSFTILYFKLLGEYFLIIDLFLITEIASELADASVGDGMSRVSLGSASFASVLLCPAQAHISPGNPFSRPQENAFRLHPFYFKNMYVSIDSAIAHSCLFMLFFLPPFFFEEGSFSVGQHGLSRNSYYSSILPSVGITTPSNF